jgi:hypothetical protein
VFLKRGSDRPAVVNPAYISPLVPLAVAYVGLRLKLSEGLGANRVFVHDLTGHKHLLSPESFRRI